MIKKILDLPFTIFHIFLHRSYPLSSSQNLAYPRISPVFQGKTPSSEKESNNAASNTPPSLILPTIRRQPVDSSLKRGSYSINDSFRLTALVSTIPPWKTLYRERRAMQFVGSGIYLKECILLLVGRTGETRTSVNNEQHPPTWGTVWWVVSWCGGTKVSRHDGLYYSPRGCSGHNGWNTTKGRNTREEKEAADVATLLEALIVSERQSRRVTRACSGCVPSPFSMGELWNYRCGNTSRYEEFLVSTRRIGIVDDSVSDMRFRGYCEDVNLTEAYLLSIIM